MKRKTKESTKEITKTILMLLGMGAVITVAGSCSGVRAPLLMRAFIRYSAWRIRETVQRLRMQGLIQYNKKDEKEPIRLTTRGIQRFRCQQWRDFLHKPKRWDYLWRIFIFDIQENKKVRQLVQKELVKMGFYQFQKSVYVHPHDCAKIMETFISDFRIWKNAVLIISPTLGRWETNVRNFFFNQ